MHNAAFRELRVDAVYLAFDVSPDLLGAAVSGARALGVAQLAVSIPHKQAVMEHLDEVDDVATAIGAVNTVTRGPDGLLRGTNTDWLGAVRALEQERPLAGTRAVVLGAGGAARGVVYGLRSRGATVTVLNRTLDRARKLAEELGAHEAGPLDALDSVDHDVLVNTTSVGLGEDRSPVAADALRPGSLVMDSVYEPERTRLLRDAEARGAKTLSGKWMLVYQAAEQLRLWTGADAPIDIMAAAFDAAAG
jgi:shikimate dehydrogenase